MLGHYLRYMLYSKPHIFIGGLMMRKVDLRMNELKKYEIIKKLVETNGNKKRAAIKLGCSLRTVNRLILKYKKDDRLLLFTVIAVDVLLPLSLLM